MDTIKEQILALKKEKNAVILAHYYVNDEVQEIADYVGDSFYLSKLATEVSEQTILFCGVFFMGESAKILNPDKTVLLPDATADCPMAHMVNISEIEKVRETYKDLAVVCYINSTAEIKAHSDVCVTSANAMKIVKALPNKNIFFIPDQNLGRHVASLVPEKNFIFNNGYCPVHTEITPEKLQQAKAEHPHAKVLVHPECTSNILSLADYVGSTSGIIAYATKSTEEEFIIGTEIGIFYELKEKNPNKVFHTINQGPLCSDMKKVTLEKVKRALETMSDEVILDESLRLRAMAPLKKMLELGK